MRDISWPRRPHPRSYFFKQARFEGLFGDNLFQLLGLASEVLDLAAGGGAGRVAGQPALASFQELFRSAVVEALGNALATAEFSDAGFAAQPVEDDADFLLGGILLAGGPAIISHEPRGRCFRGCGFLSHVHSSGGYDEPEILRSSAANSVSQVLTSDTPKLATLSMARADVRGLAAGECKRLSRAHLRNCLGPLKLSASPVLLRYSPH